MTSIFMKPWAYALAFAVSTGLAAPAIQAAVVDFEEFTLGSESYWNGSDKSGGFTSQGITFINSFADYGGYTSWEGWSYSNIKDNTTAGYGNQYSASTGNAHSGSNYGVYFAPWTSMATVTAAASCTFQGMYVTNTTYAALSMRNGDPYGYSKKFGGDTGNDNDWFKLTIIGKDASNAETNRFDFYLADYRFSNSSEDYVVDQWKYVDLTSLGNNVKSLEFVLSSSDYNTSAGYMNTPAYFAMDNLTLTAATAPEPSSIILLLSGLTALAWRWQRRKR